MSETVTYSVPAIHCAHCAMSIREEISEVEGVDEIDVDLDAKLRAAIEEAGYEAA